MGAALEGIATTVPGFAGCRLQIERDHLELVDHVSGHRGPLGIPADTLGAACMKVTDEDNELGVVALTEPSDEGLSHGALTS